MSVAWLIRGMDVRAVSTVPGMNREDDDHAVGWACTLCTRGPAARGFFFLLISFFFILTIVFFLLAKANEFS